MSDRVKHGVRMAVVGGLGVWLFHTWYKTTSTAPWYGISSGLTVISGAIAALGLFEIFGLVGKEDD